MPSLHLPPTVQAALSSGLVDIVLVPEVSPDRREENCYSRMWCGLRPPLCLLQLHKRSWPGPSAATLR